MPKEKTCLFVWIFFFLITGCSQEVIKPRVMSPTPKEKRVSQEMDTARLSETTSRDEFEDVEFYYALGVSANREG